MRSLDDIPAELRRHYTDGTTVQDAATETGLSRRTVERAFRACYAKGLFRPRVRFKPYSREAWPPSYEGPAIIGKGAPEGPCA